MGYRGCDSIYAYFMVPILLDFTPPQLDFAAASYAMEEERTEQGWFAMEESRWSRGDAPWRGGGLLCAPPPGMRHGGGGWSRGRR